MKGKMKGKMYLVLLTLIAATLWLAGCSASKDNGDKRVSTLRPTGFRRLIL